MTKENLKAKKLNPNAAVEKGEKRKERMEKGECKKRGVEFLGLALDTFGGLGPNAADALEILADETRTMKDEDEEEGAFRAKRMAQKLRLMVMRYVARQILSRSGVGRETEMTEEPLAFEEEDGEEYEDEEDEEQEDAGEEGDSEDDEEDEDADEWTAGESARTSDDEDEEKERAETFKESEADNADDEQTEASLLKAAGSKEQRRKSHHHHSRRRRGRKTNGRGQKKAKTVMIREDWLRENGVEVMDVGQGRGGECQFLSVLVTTDSSAWEEVGRTGKIDIRKVDELRRRTADWMLLHADDRMTSGVTLKESALADFPARRNEAEDQQWVRYLNGVRNGKSGQWGDDNTLIALSGVAGRTFVVVSMDRHGIVYPHNVSVPTHWGGVESPRPPVLLAHHSDYHFCPMKIRRSGSWSWCLDEGTDPRLIVDGGTNSDPRNRRENAASEPEGKQAEKMWKRRKKKIRDEEMMKDDDDSEMMKDTPRADLSSCLARISPFAQRPEKESVSSDVLETAQEVTVADRREEAGGVDAMDVDC